MATLIPQCGRVASRVTLRSSLPRLTQSQSSALRLFHSQSYLAKSSKGASKGIKQNVAATPATAQKPRASQKPSNPQSDKPVTSKPPASKPVKAEHVAASPHAQAFNVKSTEKLVYPGNLLIYNAGRPRIFAAVAIKMTSIFLFIFGATWVAPAYYFSEVHPTWAAFAVAAASTIPALTTIYAVPRFVCYVHIMLPKFARTSSDRIHRFAERLPSGTGLEVTTLRWLWPRVTRMHAEELYVKQGSALNNLALRRMVPQSVLDARKWYHWRPLDSFLVIARSGKVPEKGIWEKVVDNVVQRSRVGLKKP